MATNTTRPPTDLVGFLDYYLVVKAPFQLPDDAREWIVQFGPWVTVVMLLLALPPLLLALGLGAALTPFGGIAYTTGFTLQALGALVEIGLIAAALPGLFTRKLSSWQLILAATLVSVVFALLRGGIVGGMLGAVISLYVLFQIRPLYTA